MIPIDGEARIVFMREMSPAFGHEALALPTGMVVELVRLDDVLDPIRVGRLSDASSIAALALAGLLSGSAMPDGV